MADPDGPDGRDGDDAPVGTMQIAPRTLADSGAHQPAPLQDTIMPTTASPLPIVAPPTMPTGTRYTVEVEIARGGMGRVVEATDSVLGRRVALKEVLSLDPETLRRFKREIRITARLEHPAIVPVHDAGTQPSGAPFYVMRKVGGRALEDLVARAETLPDRLALVPHVVTAANAIAHAHERGIVHRDIKPANILVGDLGETIVIDWGLAKSIDEPDDDDLVATAPRQRVIDDDDASIKTRAGVVFGTPGFMAPEQLRGRPVDQRCDVYALGATLYHLLARRPPHHHRKADVMMRAAVDGPPRPLVELVPEVPPELATIVDKALAHDASRRYQDARALAGDLEAYLTGRLVGSHAYTVRERLARFVARNKAAVAIGTFAVVVGIAGAAFAILRITDERDRADEQARLALHEKREADAQRDEVVAKARELTLANARTLATTDPTRALAMIKPLASSDQWRAARDVGAAARAHGVAFSIPMSTRTLTLELSRDGQRALAAGDDGKVRIVDIDRRTSREIANIGGAVRARFADGERKIVLYQGNRLTILDVATGSKREVTASTPIEKLEVSGPLLYWVDPAAAVWRLDLEGDAPTRLEVGEPVSIVSPSPDGRWIAFGGTQHLLLADRSNPSLPPENKSEGAVHLAAWSADSRHLAVHIDDEVIDLHMVPVPQIWNRYRVGKRFGLAFSGGRVFSSGPLGVGQLFNPEPKLRLADPAHTLGLHEGRQKVVISAKPQGELVVLSDYGDHLLRAPAPIDLVATSARGPWIVAASAGKLLVWDLEQLEPRAFSSYPPSSARFVTGDTLVVTYQDESSEWIDLRSGKATDLGQLTGLHTILAAPDGAEALAIDVGHRAWRIAGIGKPQALPGAVDAASYVDNTRLVVAGDGAIRLDDLQTQSKRALFEHPATVRDVATTPRAGGWIAASFADGLLWRTQLTGATTRYALSIPSPGRLPLALETDGTVLVGVGSELRSWHANNKVELVATLGSPIHDIVLIAPATILAVTGDGVGHIVDIPKQRVTSQLALSLQASLAADGSLLAAPTASGGVEVIDPTVGWRWPLTTPQKGTQQPFSYVEIARDGSRVLGVTRHAVVVWTLALPQTAEETQSWLDATTNAVADSPGDPLRWR